jgi:hypothetical protein
VVEVAGEGKSWMTRRLLLRLASASEEEIGEAAGEEISEADGEGAAGEETDEEMGPNLCEKISNKSKTTLEKVTY